MLFISPILQNCCAWSLITIAAKKMFSSAHRRKPGYDFGDVIYNPGRGSRVDCALTSAAKALKGYKLSEGDISDVHFTGTPILVWLPFVKDRYFWRDLITGASIEKGAVKV